jgi:hypothetical protein
MPNQLQIKDHATSSTELANVESFTDPGEHMWHFAYVHSCFFSISELELAFICHVLFQNTNMNQKVITKRRCIYPFECVPARLDGFRLVPCSLYPSPLNHPCLICFLPMQTFNFIGMPFIEPGFCTLEADPLGCVHGVAYRMRVMDFARLQQSEGGGRYKYAMS